jgi:cell cycle sensor histidine kinase DivJ
MRGAGWQTLLPYAAAAAVPAVLSALMYRLVAAEWARLVVIFLWLGLAITACLAMGLKPFALLFLAPVIIAALFERDMIVEALLLSAVIAGLIFYANLRGALPPPIATLEGSGWSALTMPAALAALTLAALYSAAQGRHSREGTDIQRARSALSTMPGGALLIDKSNAVTPLSRSALALFGLKAERPLKLSKLLPSDAEFSKSLTELAAEARSTHKPASRTLTLKSNDGSRRIMDIVASPETQGVIIHAQDVSEREREIASLRASHSDVQKAINDKTLFFSGVSHELRTPLNAIIGFSDMMRSRLFGPLPSKYAEYADLIHDSGQHMLDLIGDVLDMSKVDAGKYELQYGSFDMADVIRSTVKMIRPAADAAAVEIELDIIDRQDLVIEADRKAVRQILLNLLSNAIKFTPKGGKVSVTAKSLADTLHLSVEDNGMGMSADELKTIGQPYVQAKSAERIDARGSGLGLSLVKSLVDLHSGRFAIASQPDEGTSVDIYLPLERAQ